MTWGPTQLAEAELGEAQRGGGPPQQGRGKGPGAEASPDCSVSWAVGRWGWVHPGAPPE